MAVCPVLRVEVLSEVRGPAAFVSCGPGGGSVQCLCCPADVCWTVAMVMSQQLAALILLAAPLFLFPLLTTLILILRTHLTVFMDLSY